METLATTDLRTGRVIHPVEEIAETFPVEVVHQEVAVDRQMIVLHLEVIHLVPLYHLLQILSIQMEVTAEVNPRTILLLDPQLMVS